MNRKVAHPYVTQAEGVPGGRPIIAGTRTSVRSIVFYHKMGETPEEISEKYPHLTFAQIYDALSFYYDHRNEIDRDLESDAEAQIRREFGL